MEEIDDLPIEPPQEQKPIEVPDVSVFTKASEGVSSYLARPGDDDAEDMPGSFLENPYFLQEVNESKDQEQLSKAIGDLENYKRDPEEEFFMLAVLS